MIKLVDAAIAHTAHVAFGCVLQTRGARAHKKPPSDFSRTAWTHGAGSSFLKNVYFYHLHRRQTEGWLRRAIVSLISGLDGFATLFLFAVRKVPASAGTLALTMPVCVCWGSRRTLPGPRDRTSLSVQYFPTSSERAASSSSSSPSSEA